MIKRLLLTTAIGLALGTAAFAQTAADPSKTETDQPAATQTATTPAPASVTLSAGVSVTEPDRTRITESVARMSVKPLRGVDFSVSVGSRVPRELRVYRLPADVVQIVPQYRDYRFLVVDKDIVIVEPSANKIVTILPRDPAITTATVTAAPTTPPATVTPATAVPATAAPATAAPTHPASTPATPSTTSTSTASAPAPATSSTPAPEQPSALSSQASAEPDRPKVKKQASRTQRMSRAARDEARWARAEVRVGQRVPDHVPLYELPPSAYRDLAAREYRTTQRAPRSYVAGPRSRLYYEYD